jgi:hypothetical protein
MVEGKGLDITSFYLAPMMPADMLSEVEQVKSIVARYFPIYDVRVSYQSITIFITPVVSSLDETFERLRIEMNEKKFIPFITYKGGEYTITIMRKGDRPPRGIWVNVILLALTVVTTIIAGAAFYGAYVGDNDLFSVSNLLWGGLTFALPLMRPNATMWRPPCRSSSLRSRPSVRWGRSFPCGTRCRTARH